MERLPLDRSVLDSALERMDIADIAQATIRQPGIRVCVSQLNRPEQFDLLEARLTAFGQNHR